MFVLLCGSNNSDRNVAKLGNRTKQNINTNSNVAKSMEWYQKWQKNKSPGVYANWLRGTVISQNSWRFLLGFFDTFPCVLQHLNWYFWFFWHSSIVLGLFYHNCLFYCVKPGFPYYWVVGWTELNAPASVKINPTSINLMTFWRWLQK